ncbi:MAG TPA: hypothetical protein VHS06_00355 [Chloroflexota bacterium]|nr:hypothetical protein [Chloroflexota bacterium]
MSPVPDKTLAELKGQEVTVSFSTPVHKLRSLTGPLQDFDPAFITIGGDGGRKIERQAIISVRPKQAGRR